MQDHIGKSLGFVKTTALGGLFFLLPLVVLVVLLGYIYSIVSVVYDPLKEWIPVSTAAGLATLFAIAVGIILLLCFAAGIVARRAIGRKFSRTVEKQLMTVFPKYAVYKDLLADNIGGSENLPSLQPIIVHLADADQLAFEADRLPDGTAVVYLPGAPDTWIGRVVLVTAQQVEPVDVPFSEFLGIFERLGRDSAKHLSAGHQCPSAE